MKLTTVKLCPDDPTITLDCFVEDFNKNRDALLVIPGGGYYCVCADREGHPIAEAFLPKNFNCFVLTYSVNKKAVFPRPLYEASLAMQYIREHSAELNINPKRVFCVGFSAGAHLAGSLGTLWHTVKEVPYGINRPTGMMLCYPVLTSAEGVCHFGSFQNICGTETPTKEQLQKYSVENNVDEKTCPAFLMHSSDDEVVPVESSIYMARELSRNNIPFELHIYPHAPHGVALGNEITSQNVPGWENEAIAKWVDHAAYWAKNIPSDK